MLLFSSQYSKVSLRRVVAQEMSEKIEVGEVAETIRQTISDGYGIVPPNLNTAIGSDGSMTITAVNRDKGLNVQIVITNLNPVPSLGAPQDAAEAPQPTQGQPIPQVPGQSVPGQPVPGQPALAQFASGQQVPGQQVPGQQVPGVPV